MRDNETKTERGIEYMTVSSHVGMNKNNIESKDEKTFIYKKLLVPNKINFTTDGSG